MQTEIDQRTAEANDKAKRLVDMKATQEIWRKQKEQLVAEKAKEEWLVTKKAKADRRTEAWRMNKQVSIRVEVWSPVLILVRYRTSRHGSGSRGRAIERQ